MGSHLALFLIFSLSSISFGGITIGITGTNASNAVASSVAGAGPNFYYSNPSGLPDGPPAVNWAQNPNGTPCTAAALQVNPNCRDPSLNFIFQATDTVATASNAIMYVRYVAAGGLAPVGSAAPGTLISGIGTRMFETGAYATNQLATASVSFGNICNILGSAGLALNAQCVMTGDPTIPVTAQLYVIADANGDGGFETGEDLLTFTFTVQSQIPINSSITDQLGFFNFQMVPGDSIVNINQTVPGGTGVSGAYAINFYYATGPDVYSPNFASTAEATFSTINPEQNEPAANTPVFQVVLNPDGTLSDNAAITGLSNGTNYYFRASVVDAAGNIGYMTPSTDDLPANPPLPFQWHAAKPDQIAGLLSKNGQCFIATAAYGTPMAKQVQILREFRDKILMKSNRGQKFVYWYYQNGNALADKIRNRDDIRAVVRTLLYPIIGYGWLALKIGAFNAALLISTFLMLPLLLIQLRKSRKTLEKFS